jgi:hypothetical protein
MEETSKDQRSSTVQNDYDEEAANDQFFRQIAFRH